VFKNEENNLLNLKERYGQVNVPLEKLDQAIQSGFERGKSKKVVINHKRKYWMWPSVVAAVLVLGLLTSIRVSPTFASYVKQVPGMEKIVELVRNDKGLLAAVENDYVQKIGISQVKNGTKVTVDSVIADEQGIVIFYTIKMKENRHNLRVENVNLQPTNGDKLPEHTLEFGHPAHEGEKTYTDTLVYFFNNPLKQQDFKLDIKVKTKEISEQFSIPFSIKKQENTKQIYNLNKTVNIEGQKIKIKKVTIYPLRVAVNVEMDPANTKKILDFEDIRLVDQHGEVWSKILNGVTASKVNDEECTLYLQSNYFKNPKELYLVINKIQAVDKDEAYLIVDTEKQQIIKQPKGNLLANIKKEGSSLTFTLNTKKDFRYFLFDSFVDANGKEFYINVGSSGFNEKKQIVSLTLPSEKYTNPIKLKLEFYPSWIEGKAKVRIR